MLSIFGDLERFISEDLFPYRHPLTIGLAVATIAVIAFACWRGWHLVLWNHKAATALIGVPLVVASVFAGDYFLSPLWERSTLCEASPIAGAGSGSDECGTGDVAIAATNPPNATDAREPTGTPDSTQAPDATDAPLATETPAFEPTIIQRGSFVGADDFHFGEGAALLIGTAPGAYTLRFEDFSVRNGPNLFVYLSTDPNGYSDDALNLGDLKATDGAFNYDIPTGTDVSQFKSAIVWCKAFGVLFATATFQ